MKPLAFTLIASSLALAGVPHTFSSGNPARASEVNDNFHSLDSLKANQTGLDSLRAQVAGKASQSGVDLVQAAVGAAVDTAKFSKALGAKLDTADLTKRLNGLPTVSVTGKADQSWVRDSLKNVASKDTLKNFATTATLAAKVDTADLTKRLNGLPTISVAGKADQSWVRDTLKNLASKDTLKNFVQNSTLAPYAKATDLGDYAKSTDLTLGLAAKSSQSWVRDTLKQFAALNSDSMLAIPHSGGLLVAGKGSDAPFLLDAFGSRGSFPRWEMGSFGGDQINLQWRTGIYSGVGLSMDKNGTVSIRDVIAWTLIAGGINADSIRISSDIHVGGKVFASTSSITVPDYVFEPSYQLTPLSELESYTQREKHLPEIPSATEIAKGGMDLTEMNLLLLKKVEELTLHAIEQNKKLEAQEARIRSLESKP